MRRLLLVVALSLAVVAPASAEVRLAALFADGVVLQRERDIPVWGTATPGADVTVALDDDSQRAKAGADGKWQVRLAPRKAGGPHVLKVQEAGAAQAVEVKDVLVGEVWLASGQSNMHWTFSHNIRDKEKELDAANDPQLRQFTVGKGQAKQPADDVKGSWHRADRAGLLAEGTNGSSAVGYFFGRALRRELKVPVGIINSSVGGTPIEQWSPGGGLFNNMIHPLAPFALRGAVWYQGESNCIGRAGMKYVDLKNKMVTGWRDLWKQGEFPFYYVQIAPYTYTARPMPKLPSYILPEFWQAQTAVMAAVPKTGMVVINDLVDNVRDIHPANKQDVGERLARWALANDYGRSDLEYSGPTFREAIGEGASIRVRFDHARGLTSRDGEQLSHFLLAGKDRTFHPAVATIDGDAVVVRSAKVTNPVAVRFAWDEQAMPNLVNQAGLPTSSFRSDDWPLEE